MQVICRCYASSDSLLAQLPLGDGRHCGVRAVDAPADYWVRERQLAAAGRSYWARAPSCKWHSLSAVRNADSTAMSWTAAMPYICLRRAVRLLAGHTDSTPTAPASRSMAVSPSPAQSRCNRAAVLATAAPSPRCCPMHVPAVKPQRPAQIVSQAGPTRVANTRQRSPKPTASMQCAQNVLHQWPVARSNSLSGPFGTLHSVQPRFLTLLTVTRLIAGLITLLLAAGPPGPMAQSPFLSLFAVHTTSLPTSIPRHPALVEPAMTEDLCTRLAPACGKNELLQSLV
jgi:hypothetical protein